MPNDNMNPSTDPMYELETVEFKIRCAVRVLLDLTNMENDIEPISLDYIACALHEHTKKLANLVNNIDSINVAGQGDRRAV